ncbi:MAG: rod shape-determining protein MreC [Clostridia bacterium]|nr:rod shape-determining protein MreC [Clostridia bacterium]
MQGFFKSWRFRVIAVIALLVLGLMLRAATSGGFATVPADVISFIVTPVERLSSRVSNAATDFFASFTNYSVIKAENDSLKKQMQQLNSEAVDYDKLKQQNEQDKEYLGIKEEKSDLKLVFGSVISHDPGQWFSAFTVDKGSLDGILKGDPVITPDGLVGVVSQVMSTSSVVTTILDPSTSIGALISHTGDTCLAKGDSELMSKGALNLVYIPRGSNVTDGDIVITSGIGGIYPKGLMIATVQSIGLDINMSKYAVVKPMTDISSIRSCSVITSFKGKAAASSSSSGGS